MYYNNSHQHYEKVTIEVSHSSMFRNHSSLNMLNAKVNLLNVYNLKTQRQLKDSWGSYTATGSEITEGEQLPCNTHQSLFMTWLYHFTNQA